MQNHANIALLFGQARQEQRFFLPQRAQKNFLKSELQRNALTPDPAAYFFSRPQFWRKYLNSKILKYLLEFSCAMRLGAGRMRGIVRRLHLCDSSCWNLQKSEMDEWRSAAIADECRSLAFRNLLSKPDSRRVISDYPTCCDSAGTCPPVRTTPAILPPQIFSPQQASSKYPGRRVYGYLPACGAEFDAPTAAR